MASYKYEVVGADGKPKTGTIEAMNMEVASAELKSGGNHLHHEIRKNLRVLRHRNGEGLPALYGIPHFCDCVGKRFVLGLLG